MGDASVVAFAIGVAIGAVLLLALIAPLFALNFLVLQWFGIRLARIVELRRRPVTVGWLVVRWLWPLTGWWSDYRWISRRGGFS